MIIEDAAQKYTVRGIPANLVEHFWTYAEPYIKRALEHTTGEWLPSDIKMFCKDRGMQLWLVSEGDRVIAAATTELVKYPQKQHCRIVTLAGSKAPEWTGLAGEIIRLWAIENGCSAIEAFVRKGYVPILAQYGFKHRYSSVIKEI